MLAIWHVRKSALLLPLRRDYLQEGSLVHVGRDEAKKQKEPEQEEKNAIGAEAERQQSEGKEVTEDDARGACSP